MLRSVAARARSSSKGAGQHLDLVRPSAGCSGGATPTDACSTKLIKIPKSNIINPFERGLSSAPPFNRQLRMGIDVGSTTVKVVCLDSSDEIVYGDYRRHKADVRATTVQALADCIESLEKKYGTDLPILRPCITGSGGLTISNLIAMRFVQEVIASTTAVQKLIPQTDVAVELGGEDAKITYFGDSIEQRMNGTCAGGTGAFIDQMAALLKTDAHGLNELSRNSETIYPIAARCGVFAKTDIQPLINEGARREDIATSIYQAVVNQTISGLACGKPIKGKVAFLGGPLHFLDQLEHRFVDTLQLSKEEEITVPNAQLFVALGAAYASGSQRQGRCDADHPATLTVEQLRSSLKTLQTIEIHEVRRLDPLFKNDDELKEFQARHAKAKVKRAPLETARGPLFLGIDAGSTTTKAVLIDQDGAVIWEFYDHNGGNPVELAVKVLKDLYAKLPEGAHIARSCSTGYGEILFQSALGVDAGEVETIAHHKATDFFVPGVEFVIDIGGQDMKYVRLKDGAIQTIQLNEACSSGCGSFLDNFAHSLSMSIQDFAQLALKAGSPVDLGSRCTVFMNSRVKQAQKEGASVADISAGLSYSVIKNALIKVIKMRDPKDIGEKVVCQGGTFNNDSVLRAFELISGRQVIRPDISGLMGAYGAALIAKEQWIDGGADPKAQSTLCSKDELENFRVSLVSKRCSGCNNKCLLTINSFESGGQVRKFITGNRCDNGLELNLGDGHVQSKKQHKQLPNLYKEHEKRVFKYKPLPIAQAPRGVVGIPRVLNIYQDYPFWFTFFTKLGYRVVLSPRSSRDIFELGLDSIPSESVCFPAKLAHGHVESLLKQGVKFIFLPSITYNKNEDKGSVRDYNCPVVNAYTEVLQNNIDALRQDPTVTYKCPFLSLQDEKRLAKRLAEEFPDIPKKDVRAATHAAWEELEQFKKDCHDMGTRALKEIEDRGLKGVVLAGRPYHRDPEVHHGIPELINSLGLAVLTEDAVAHLAEIERPLRVSDQWSFHNRLYRSAQYVTTNPNIEFVQMTSFGCGLDALTADQSEEILTSKNRMHTLLKVDEGANLGAVRIRMRSLIAAMKERAKHPSTAPVKSSAHPPLIFTEDMRLQGYTILAPTMAPIQFQFIEHALRSGGNKLVILPTVTPEMVDTGLKLVNNDACYPCIVTTGQLMHALQSGEYDLNKTALIMAQTCGSCRLTNYIGVIRKALQDIGLGHIPVINLSTGGREKHPGFKMNVGVLHRLLKSIVISDVLMKCLYRTRPYEVVPESANAMYDKWAKLGEHMSTTNSISDYSQLIDEIVKDFDSLPLVSQRKPRIGVVGEIFAKYHPYTNNYLVDTIEREGAEAVMGDFLDSLMIVLKEDETNFYRYTAPFTDVIKSKVAIGLMELYRRPAFRALSRSKRFDPPTKIDDYQKIKGDIMDIGSNCSEGWLMVSEILHLIDRGAQSVVTVQPFACLPNHINTKGMIKEIRRRRPGSNVIAIDFDPGASEVNQLNRLKLCLSNAKLGPHPDETKSGWKY